MKTMWSKESQEWYELIVISKAQLQEYQRLIDKFGYTEEMIARRLANIHYSFKADPRAIAKKLFEEKILIKR